MFKKSYKNLNKLKFNGKDYKLKINIYIIYKYHKNNNSLIIRIKFSSPLETKSFIIKEEKFKIILIQAIKINVLSSVYILKIN